MVVTAGRPTVPILDDSAHSQFRRLIEVRQEAELLLGVNQWRLLSGFGMLNDGPREGCYVCGIPFDEQLELVRRLARREMVSVHLMHKRKPGNYARSTLRRCPRALVMVFADREEVA